MLVVFIYILKYDILSQVVLIEGRIRIVKKISFKGNRIIIGRSKKKTTKKQRKKVWTFLLLE